MLQGHLGGTLMKAKGHCESRAEGLSHSSHSKKNAKHIVSVFCSEQHCASPYPTNINIHLYLEKEKALA